MSRRVLVVQFGRIGDTIYTTPTLRGLKGDGSTHTTLVVFDAFADVPVPRALYDELRPFPMAGTAALLAADHGAWRRASAALETFRASLGSQPFDLAVNLSHTELSGLVMSLVAAQRKVGSVVDPDRRITTRGGWMRYLRATAGVRALSGVHLADVFARAAGAPLDGGGLQLDVAEAAGARVQAWLAERSPGGRPLVAVQLGASQESKRWPVERFAAAVDLLPSDAGDVVLVGVQGERPLAEEFRALTKRPTHDAVGRTSLDELAALLARCRVLVTNDTGTMHVASAVGTRVVDISSGPVSVHETGPYGDGHVVVEPVLACYPCPVGTVCGHQSCRQHLAPADAAAAIRFAMGESGAPRPDRSRLMTSRRLPTGRIVFEPLDPTRRSAVDVLRRRSADMWEESLEDGRGDRAGRAHRATPARPIEPSLGAAARSLRDVSREATAAAADIEKIPTASPNQGRSLAQRADGRLERLIALAAAEPAALPIVTFLRHEIHAIGDAGMSAVVEAQARAYRDAAARSRRLSDLLESEGNSSRDTGGAAAHS